MTNDNTSNRTGSNYTKRLWVFYPEVALYKFAITVTIIEIVIIYECGYDDIIAVTYKPGREFRSVEDSDGQHPRPQYGFGARLRKSQYIWRLSVMFVSKSCERGAQVGQ